MRAEARRRTTAPGRLDDAIASFRTALRLSPDFIDAHRAVAAAPLLEGDPRPRLEKPREPDRTFEWLAKAVRYSDRPRAP